MGLIAGLDRDALFASPARMALALRLAIVDLISGDHDFEIVADVNAEFPMQPGSRDEHFTIVEQCGGDAYQVRVIDVASPLYELIALANSIGFSKSRDALKPFKAREKEQSEAGHQPKPQPIPDDDPDSDQDNEDQDDEDRPARVTVTITRPRPTSGASPTIGDSIDEVRRGT
jgi:hypothetical protein